MPNLGDIIYRKERGFNKFIWLACRKCAKGRWVQLSHTTLPQFTNLCKDCWRHKAKGPYPKGIDSPNWRGSRRLKDTGYIVIPLDKQSPFYPMADGDGSVFEHRLIVAQYLGRCLQPCEIVHHKNGVKTDNRTENLELLPSRFEHIQKHKIKTQNNS